MPNGRFTVHYSHWGATNLELADKITADTPLGGEDMAPGFLDAFTEMLEDATDGEVEGRAVEDDQETAVEPEPLVANVTMHDICNALNYTMIEALYVVEGVATDEFDVHGFVPVLVPFGEAHSNILDGDLSEMAQEAEPMAPFDTDTNGILIEPRPHKLPMGADGDATTPAYRDYAYDLGWLRGVREMLAGLTGEKGGITAGEAATAFGRELAESNDPVDLAALGGMLRDRLDAGEANLLTPEAAREAFVRVALARYTDSLDKRVLSHSAAVTPQHLADYPEAFVRMGGRTRVLGDMYPTSYKDDSTHPWMLADELELPEPV